MQTESSQESRNQDRRVLRSRSSLMAAAVRLVSERGTTAIPITDLAEAANVGRQVVYLQFGDRDSLLVEAAVDLVRRELIPQVEPGAEFTAVGAMARHFAQHRSFYRAMLTGSCAFAMNNALLAFLRPLNGSAVRELFGELDEDTARDLATVLVGGTATVVNNWLLEGDDPLDPESLTERLLRLASVLGGIRQAQAGRDRNQSC